MSQGPHTIASSDAEPNLVPLLDLVLQLVMFFMMCANFVMEENDQTIKLPHSQQCERAHGEQASRARGGPSRSRKPGPTSYTSVSPRRGMSAWSAGRSR